jgi:hypothetical protein
VAGEKNAFGFVEIVEHERDQKTGIREEMKQEGIMTRKRVARVRDLGSCFPAICRLHYSVGEVPSVRAC